MRWILAALCVVLIPLRVWAQTAPASAAAPAAPPSVFSSRVLTPEGKPIAGASVLLYDQVTGPTIPSPSVPPIEKATTDAAGRFQLRSIPRTFTLIIQASSYGLWAHSGGPSYEELSLPEIKLPLSTSLRLHITDSTGQPLAGVRVGLVSINVPNNSAGAIPQELCQRLAQPTDASGTCLLPDLPQQANIVLRILDRQYFFANYVSARTEVLEITNIAPFRVTKGGTIEGRLTRADTGAPVPNVRIIDQIFYRTSPSSSTSRNAYADTDAQGKFTLIQLYPGTHTLCAQLEPPLNAQLTSTNSDPLELAEGQQLAEVKLELAEGALIHGKATAEDTGKPIAGGTVSLGASGSGRAEIGRTVTGPDGTYAIMVVPGQYTVHISNLANQGFLPPKPNVRPVIANMGQDGTLDFVCPPNPNAAVKGRLVDAQGRPIASAVIIASPAGGGGGSFASLDQITLYMEESGGTAATDADGKFSIPFVTDRATLSIRKGTGGGAGGGVGGGAGGGDLRLSEPVTIDATHRDLALTALKNPTGTLVVRVVDDSDQPLAGVTVTVTWRSTSPYNSGVTGQDGTYRLTALPTDQIYFINASGRGYSSAATSIIKIEADKETVLSLKVARTDNFVIGTVVDANKKPIGGVTVRATGSVSPISARTGPDGRFVIRNVVPGGTVTVHVFVDGVEADPNGTSIKAGTNDAIILFDPTTTRPAPKSP